MIPEPETRNVRVWDLPTRIFHWLLAATVIGSVVTAKIGGNAAVWHFRLGYLVLTLLAFRFIWGLVGGHWSRFANFIYAPATLLRYLRGQARAGEHLDVGHSPLGALSVFGLLLFLLFQVSTGLVADDEISNVGPLNRFVASATAGLATTYHKAIGQYVLIVMVLLHIGAVLYYLWAKKRNLIRPMIDGHKVLGVGVPQAMDSLRTRSVAAVIVAVCGLAVWRLVSLGG